MKTTLTPRGLAIIEFKDRNAVKCNIQESSLASENAIWFGAESIGLRQMIPDVGWTDIDIDPLNSVANNRMHLTQEQVKGLLPILAHFAEHGELPDLK